MILTCIHTPFPYNSSIKLVYSFYIMSHFVYIIFHYSEETSWITFSYIKKHDSILYHYFSSSVALSIFLHRLLDVILLYIHSQLSKLQSVYIVMAPLFFEGYYTEAVHVILRYSGVLCDESVEHRLSGKAIERKKDCFPQSLM